MSFQQQHNDDRQVSQRKHAYRSPEFRIHGNIQDVTQGFGKNNNKDGGGSGMTPGFKSLA